MWDVAAMDWKGIAGHSEVRIATVLSTVIAAVLVTGIATVHNQITHLPLKLQVTF